VGSGALSNSSGGREIIMSRRPGWLFAGILSIFVIGCGSGGNSAEAPAASAPAGGPASTPVAAGADNACPLTVEQVSGVTGTAMTHTGGCTFFPASGRDIPHVFYVLQVPMVCTSIKPADLGFKEAVDGLATSGAYVLDQLDGSHVLVCPTGNGRAFDIVVDIKGDKAANREAAVALAKQVIARR